MDLAEAVVPAITTEANTRVTGVKAARVTGVKATSTTAATTAATKTEAKAAMMVMVTPSINHACVCCSITAEHYCCKCCYN